jgi:hypothetical protein
VAPKPASPGPADLGRQDELVEELAELVGLDVVAQHGDVVA